MSSNQIVFLFDLNAFNHDNLTSGRELDRSLRCLRLACLRILTHYSALTPDLRWGFKFFDSCGVLTQLMSKFSYTNLTLESVEALESEISTRYHRHRAYIDALSESVKRDIAPTHLDFPSPRTKSDVTMPVQLLHLALTQILCEYKFDDFGIFSPLKQKKVHSQSQKRNLMFLVSECPDSEADFSRYFGRELSSVDLPRFKKVLLSPSLQDQLLEKASVMWVWLNTSDDFTFLDFPKPRCLSIVAETMKMWQGALIPLTVLSTQSHILRFQDHQKQSFGNVHTSFIPFSTSFVQSLSFPFYSEKTSSFRTKLIFNQNVLEIDITLSKISYLKSSSSTDLPCWTKCTALFALPKTVFLPPEKMFLCLPEFSTRHKLIDIVKNLYVNELNLFLVCECANGTTSAILSPLTDIFSVLTTFHPQFHASNFSLPVFEKHKENTLPLETKAEDIIENLKSKITGIQKINNKLQMKPFQMECLEAWFAPTAAIRDFVSEKQTDPESNHKTEMLPEILKSCKTLHQKTVTNKTKLFVQKGEKTASTNSLSKETTKIKPIIEIDDLAADVNYDQLIRILTEIYECAIKSSSSVLHNGKKIVKYASTFFLRKSIRSYEENMKSFMAEYFILSNWKITEKYNESQEPDTAAMKINECQLQAIITLEMEILFPSSERSTCINPVTSYLRLMSFYSGASELNKFLCEDLKDHYAGKLYDILVEIGDELDIPLVAEEDDLSPDNRSEAASSEVMFEMPGSVVSNLSTRSSSSASSRSDSRKLMRRRSDISDSHKSRQVLLPATSPKKKRKSHGAEKISVRYSPRLASKKKRERMKALESKPETVRRNLFPKDRKPQTPRVSKFSSPYGKKKATTPKSYHVLKTQFVAETPSHKQNQSALQRKKSFIEEQSSESSFTEVAESPTIKNVKDSAQLRLLQKLKNSLQSNKSSNSNDSGAKTLPGCSSYTQYTPESKRRLSLKLFSKFLTSPTARMGLKKCSKRLFEPVSPQVHRPPSKRPKLDDNAKECISRSAVRTSLFKSCDL